MIPVPDGEAVAGILDAAVEEGQLPPVPTPGDGLPGSPLAVTTGQQPALFGGPMYTVHKAIAARALADRLSRLHGRPFEPVFWMAGDDHDWSEAAATAWWDSDRRFREWHAEPRANGEPALPMYRTPLPADVPRLAAEITGARRNTPSGGWTAGWLDRHWHPGATVHGAAAGALRELLGGMGIRCIDPTEESFKVRQVPVLAEALERAGEIDRALAALPDPGTGIEAGQGATLVFVETEAGRERLLIDGGGFRARRSGRSWSRPEMLALLDAEPARFSANVLLRPVVEAALIPTVAYVAGPGEFRYLTRQAATVYEVLGRRRQEPVARWGGSVIDVVSDRLLDRLGIDPRIALSGGRELEAEVMRRDLPAEVGEAIAVLQGGIDEAFGVLDRMAPAIDPVLARAMAGRRRHFELRVDELRRLLERHHRRRDGIALSQYRRVLESLLPGGAPQERVISVAAALARWGGEWLRAAGDAADAWASRLAAADGAPVR